MHGDRVLDGSLDQLVLVVGRDGDGAVVFAREFPAIDVLA
jgi:hypothetical protein